MSWSLVDVIHELANFIIDAATAVIAFGMLWSGPPPITHEMAGTVVAKALTLSRLSGVALVIVVNLIIFAAAPRIARFATKFAGEEESVAQV